MDQGERPVLNMDLPGEIAFAARDGNIDAVREWLAAGGAPDAIKPNGTSVLALACMSSRPSCAAVVEHLCAAGARDVGAPRCIGLAATVGALDTVRVLLRYGAPANAEIDGTTPLHQVVVTNHWTKLIDPWSKANARAASSIGHQGLVRLLLKHGAAVNAPTTRERLTPLMGAAIYAGFISLSVARELLAAGADLDMVSAGGQNAEAFARSQLQKHIYNGEGIPEDPRSCRRPGAVEAFLELCAGVRAAGSWKRYVNAPRVQLVVLRKLTERGRATVPRYRDMHALFACRTLPDVIFWKILEFWGTDRDPPSC